MFVEVFLNNNSILHDIVIITIVTYNLYIAKIIVKHIV